MSRFIFWTGFGLLILWFSNVHAYTLVPLVGINIEKHDNITKTNDANAVDDTVLKPYFGFELVEQTDLFLINMGVRLEQERYQDNTFTDKEVPDVNAYLGWKILPGRLLWSFEDAATREQLNTLLISNPDNYQNVNVFSTGPDLLFARGAWKSVLKFRYNDVSFSESNDDSNALTSSVYINRELNAYSRLGGVFYFQDIGYDSTEDEDYELYQIYLSYKRDLPYGLFQANIGTNTLSSSNKDRTEPYGMLRLTYDQGSGLRGQLSYSSWFSDPSASLSNPERTTLDSIDTGNISTGLVRASTVNPSQLDAFSLVFGHNSGRLSTTINLYTQSRDYFGLEDDRDNDGIRVNLGYELTSKLKSSLIASREKTDFIGTDIDDTDSLIRAELDYELSRGLFVNIGLGREQKESSDATRDSEDDIIFVGIGYRGKEKQ